MCVSRKLKIVFNVLLLSHVDELEKGSGWRRERRRGAQERESNGGRAAAPGNEQESQRRMVGLVRIKIVQHKCFPLAVTKVVLRFEIRG
jgi:hypothetical protein